jgi:large repetitive protein
MKTVVVLFVLLAFFNISALAQGACIKPVITEVRGGGTYCTGELVTLRVIGSLNSAIEWAWYSNKCGGTKVGSGASIVVEVNESITYYVRGLGFCFAVPEACTSVQVNLEDNPPVVISSPSDMVVANSTGQCGAIVNFAVPQGQDDCSAVTAALIKGLAPGSLFPIGITEVQYELSDAAGSKTLVSFNVTVQDKELPVIVCPQDIVVNNESGKCGAVVSYQVPQGSDNCAGATTKLSAGLGSGAFFPTGVSTETYTVTDAAGNITTCSFKVTVQNQQLPVITCPADITVNSESGKCGAMVSYQVPQGSSSCSGVTTKLTAGLGSGAIFPVGVTTETYTVTDAAGKTASCSFKVTVKDTGLPSIVCPADLNVNTDPGKCGAVVNYTVPHGSSSCAGVTTKLTAGLGTGAFFPVGVTTETYTATDATGKTATCSFKITVKDGGPPVIVCPVDITVSNEAGKCGAVVNYQAPQGSDNCLTATTKLSAGLGSGAFFPVGVTTETYTVTDAVGNTATCSFKVTVQDKQLPVIVCPADVTVSNDPGKCGAIVKYQAPQGTDNCPGATTKLSSGLGSGAYFPKGSSTETYTVTDAAGNITTCSFKVIVKDTELPVIICPADITVNNEAGKCGAVVSYQAPLGTDNCTGAITKFSAGLGSGAFFPVGVTTETYTVTDVAGNVATCSFKVTVKDKELPMITCPADITANNESGKCGAVVSYQAPKGSDNCSGATTKLSAGLGSGAFFPVGVTTETYTVTDAAGNMATCSFKVTILDKDVPTIICPKDIVENNDPGKCGAVVNYQVPMGSDNCPDPTVKLSSGLGSGAFFPIGVTTETYAVTDAAGNTATCSFKITVEDKELPVIVCPADIKVSNEPGKCGAVVKYEVPKGTDNCAGATTEFTTGLGSGAYFPVGVTTETYTVTDAAGNTSTCSFKVTVKDNELPVIACTPDITVNNESGKCGAVVNYPVPEGSDNCPDATTKRTSGLGSGAFFPVGVTTEKYTVTDAAGNTATCSIKVTVKDKDVPVIDCPENITVDNDKGKCGAVVKYDVPKGSDNCQGWTTELTAGLGSGAFFPVGTTTETYTVTDDAGNEASCSFKVTVKDVEAPVITVCKEITMWPPNHKHHAFAVKDLVGSVRDNCGDVSINDVVIDKVGSDEPNNGTGDGNTEDDIIISNDCRTVYLQAERAGNRNGRVYVITLAVMDEKGNISTTNVNVEVPHDNGSKGSAILDDIVYTVNGCDLVFDPDTQTADSNNGEGNTPEDPNDETGRTGTQLSVHPNPFNDSFTVTFTAPANDHVKVEMYNLLGVKVAQVHEQDVEVDQSYEWQIDNAPVNATEYVLIIRGNITRQVARVIRKE